MNTWNALTALDAWNEPALKFYDSQGMINAASNRIQQILEDWKILLDCFEDIEAKELLFN